jgi:hypothetical protein
MHTHTHARTHTHTNTHSHTHTPGRIHAVTTNALSQLAKGCLFMDELFLEDCTGITKVRARVCVSGRVRA